mmetsp:Transcript_48295/g.73021  ORF Transcript_48295/g.73021 Transcript_48295/m.73021 type:complete len:859 (+) Transcript_48295:322-2898(+)
MRARDSKIHITHSFISGIASLYYKGGNCGYKEHTLLCPGTMSIPLLHHHPPTCDCSNPCGQNETRREADYNIKTVGCVHSDSIRNKNTFRATNSSMRQRREWKGQRKKRLISHLLQQLLPCVLLLIVLLMGKVNALHGMLDNGKEYEWEDWSYYEILGHFHPINRDEKPKGRLRRRKEFAAIKHSDLRRSYRKQAQLWHPDKMAGRKLKNTSTAEAPKDKDMPGPDLETSVEESTARFARIAEAYQTLSDAEKREEYNDELLDWQDEQYKQLKRQKQQETQRQHSGPDAKRSFVGAFTSTTKSKDPWKVFEEFFFSSSGSENGQYGFSETNHEEFVKMGEERHGKPSFHGGYHPNNRPFDADDFVNPSGRFKRHKYNGPPRVSEATQVRYDPRFQSEVLCVLRREEYTDARTGQIYFRVIGQDFLEERNHVYGRLGYRPVTEPYLVEEGHISTSKGENAKKYKTHFDRLSNRQSPFKIEPGEIITPDTEELLTSPDRRYYAGVTPDCELIVMRDEGSDKEDTIIWSSDTFLPPSHVSNSRCFFSMYGPQLVLFVGEDVDRITAVLWSSPPPPIVPDRDLRNNGVKQEYYASLDNDGSLAVYRRRVGGNYDDLSMFDEDGGNIWLSFKRASVHSLRGESSASTQHEQNGGSSMRHQAWRDDCIYATGVSGCLTAGRRAVLLGQRMKRSFRNFKDHVSDEAEDGEDFIDALWRIVGKAGRTAFLRGAHSSKMVALVVKDVVKEKWTKVHESVEHVTCESRRKMGDALIQSRQKINNISARGGKRLKHLAEEGWKNRDRIGQAGKNIGRASIKIASQGVNGSIALAGAVETKLNRLHKQVEFLVDKSRKRRETFTSGSQMR